MLGESSRVLETDHAKFIVVEVDEIALDIYVQCIRFAGETS